MTALVLTHSAMRTLRTCPEKYRLAYEEGVRPERQAEPLRVGSHFHAAIAAENPLQFILDTYSQAPAFETPDGLQDWLVEGAKLYELVAGYLARWAGDGVTVLWRERSFSLPIGRRRARSAGVIDGLVTLPDGRRAVLEEKTTTEDISPAADYWRRLRHDVQITRYMLAAREMGLDPQTVLYSVTRKPGIRPKQITKADLKQLSESGTYCGQTVAASVVANVMALASTTDKPIEPAGLYGLRLRQNIQENPERYYQRIEIPRMEADFDAFRAKMHQDIDEVRFRRKAGAWQRNDNACMAMGRCAYFDLCANNYQPHSELPAGFERVANKHPELGAQA